MSTYDQLIALAERCEKELSSSYSLECDIAKALAQFATPPLNYTSSIDMAMTLVPEGTVADTMARKRHHILIEYTETAWARIESLDGARFLGVAKAVTLPLAICAAALRARVALLKAGGGQ